MSTESVETPVEAVEPVKAVDVLASLTPTQKDHWRLTGELPGQATESALPSEAEPDDEPEPATPVIEETPKAGKPRHDMKARLGQLTEEKKTAIARAEAAEQRAKDLEARLQPASASAPQPTPTPTPLVAGQFQDRDGKVYDFRQPEATWIDQFVAFGFADPYAAMARVVARYETAVAMYTARQEYATAQAGESIRARQADIDKAGQEKYPDWHERLTAPDVKDVRLPPHVMQLLHESPLSVDVLYHLSKHPAEVRALAAMEPLHAAKTLGSLETRLSGDTSRPAAKTTSDAPPPPTTLGSKAAPPGDELEAAIASRDFSRYRELANARDLAGAKR